MQIVPRKPVAPQTIIQSIERFIQVCVALQYSPVGIAVLPDVCEIHDTSESPQIIPFVKEIRDEMKISVEDHHKE